MSPDSIVVGLEQAKILKEADFPQNMCFQWFNEHDPFKGENKWILEDGPCNGDTRGVAAPTASEILDRLPHMIDGGDGWMALLRVMPNENEWQVFYDPVAGEKGDTLANAAAAMYVFLSENNLLP